jgi:hypothetical protein
MAINVTYQVPASLLQQQRQAENRAYKRQVNLMTMQQNFQREQTEANRQFQRETMQTAYDRQREKTADERTYQQELLAHKEGREDALRKQAMELAERQRQEAQIQQAETAAWQASERQRQALEKQFNYTDTQIAEMKQLAADERDAYQQYSQGLISPEQYRSALGQLRARRMGIMPETPKKPEETMSMAERIDHMTVVDPNTGFRMGINSKGEVYYAKPPMDSTDTRMMTSIFELAAKAAMGNDEAGNPIFKKDIYDQVVRDMTARYRYHQATRMPFNNPAQAQARRRAMETAMGERGTPFRAKPKFSVPQTGPDYVKQNMGGGNPLQQMMGQQQQMLQQQQEQPQPQAEPMQTPEEIQQLQKKIEDDAAEQLFKWKVSARKQAKLNFLRKRQSGEDVESAKRQYRERMKAIDDATEIPRTQQTKQTEQPKKEEPKRQTTSVTFNDISDINGLKAWVNGKRLAVGDEMPNGGKITDLDFDNGTLTYELDGKKYTIRKSRNAQNI